MKNNLTEKSTIFPRRLFLKLLSQNAFLRGRNRYQTFHLVTANTLE